jgi:hypothetical protein
MVCNFSDLLTDLTVLGSTSCWTLRMQPQISGLGDGIISGSCNDSFAHPVPGWEKEPVGTDSDKLRLEDGRSDDAGRKSAR